MTENICSANESVLQKLEAVTYMSRSVAALKEATEHGPDPRKASEFDGEAADPSMPAETGNRTADMMSGLPSIVDC